MNRKSFIASLIAIPAAMAKAAKPVELSHKMITPTGTVTFKNCSIIEPSPPLPDNEAYKAFFNPTIPQRYQF